MGQDRKEERTCVDWEASDDALLPSLPRDVVASTHLAEGGGGQGRSGMDDVRTDPERSDNRRRIEEEQQAIRAIYGEDACKKGYGDWDWEVRRNERTVDDVTNARTHVRTTRPNHARLRSLLTRLASHVRALCFR